MDYLPIQVSSVPCERVFLSSAKTDTKRRNGISSLLMEVLLMLKVFIKRDSLNFMLSWKIEEKNCPQTSQKLIFLMSWKRVVMIRTIPNTLRTSKK